ncbi:hypothetical protein KY315_00730 [Candidatus Woesearchaeota archaeon]|nr:hypothetical protein [Candidatus Woesearchaeota archaeon]
MIDKKIVNLLTKIGCIWQPQFSDVQLKNISVFWQRKLLRYTDEVIVEALDALAETFHRKPTLADFVERCKDIISRQAPAQVSVFKSDFISKHVYQTFIAKNYGAEAVKAVDLAYAEYYRAMQNGTLEIYRNSVLTRFSKLARKQFSL